MSSNRENKDKATSPALEPTGAGKEQDRLPRVAISSTVAKAFRIVDILAFRAEAGASLSELSILLEMPKSSAHRYLSTLLELGLAERRSRDRFYLGTRVIELAGSFLANSDLRQESQAILNEIAATSGETVHLAVPSGADVVYIAKVEGKHTLGMYSHIGARLPMYCTALGKAILAFSPVECLQEVFAEPLNSRTHNTITTEASLKLELDLIHLQGFAVDNEENEVGICCVGAPILDYTGRAIAAMSISGPKERVDRERCIQLGPLIREATLRISKRKGFTGRFYEIST